MKQRFILYRRKLGGMFYIEDTESRKQESLGTKDRTEAVSILNARNEAVRQPHLNLQIATSAIWPDVRQPKAKEGSIDETWTRVHPRSFVVSERKPLNRLMVPNPRQKRPECESVIGLSSNADVLGSVVADFPGTNCRENAFNSSRGRQVPTYGRTI